MEYKESDIPKFVEEVCKKCNCWEDGVEGGCKNILEKKNLQWFLYCGKYFNWKLHIKTWMDIQREWEESHPEEVEKRKKQYEEYLKKKKKEASEKRKSKKINNKIKDK